MKHKHSFLNSWVPVVQWIEQWFPKPKIQVRFLAGIPVSHYQCSGPALQAGLVVAVFLGTILGGDTSLEKAILLGPVRAAFV